ncbi:hypothetical protein ACHAXR_003897, partial [Thalassiosira sp. AJA248-18]
QREQARAENNIDATYWATATHARRIAVDIGARALEPFVYAELDDPDEGLDGVNIRDLYDHIMDRFAKISQVEIDANLVEFNEGIDPSKTLAVYTRKQELCQEIANDAGVEITEATMVTTGTKHAVAAGGMDDAWKTWVRMAVPLRTWPAWKTHWTAAFQEKRELVKLTGIAFNDMANSSIQQSEMGDKMVTALDNLANAAVDRNYSVETLVKANNTLSTTIQSQQDEIKRLLAIVSAMSTGKPAPPPTSTGSGDSNWDPNGYCWWHGFKVKHGHSSSTCDKGKRDTTNYALHKDAKRGDEQGGQTWNQNWKAKNNLANNVSSYSGCANPPDINSTALVDSAANVTIINHDAPATEATTQLPTKSIIQPAGARMFTDKTMELLLSKLPKAARAAHRARKLTNNLLSVSVLCDAGCEVFFHAQGCEISFNGETILRGWRDLATNMWRISLIPDGGQNIIPADDNDNFTSEVPMPDFFANSIYECETTGQLIQFYHATMGYPVTSTWCKAIDAGYFRGWPGLTSTRVRRFIKVVDETEMGHMDQRKVGIRSTRATPTQDSMTPVPQSPLNDRTHHVYMSITDIEGKLYSDQTGRFPITSNRGNCYVIIFYAVDGNYIKSYPIKSRHRSQLLKAYDDVYAFLRIRGYRPQLHKLDNETSHDVESFITEQQAKVQYTPADMHRTNLAERAVRTWKNHFAATRAGTPSSFKMSNWCKMLEQCDITLNMMRPCTLNPLLSAFEAMEGMYSFDATPMAPIGTEMLMHLKPIRRHTWDYHAVKAWYFAPALKHYRVVKGVLESGAVRLTDTWKFKHHALTIPTVSAADRIAKATQHLASTIQGANNAPPDELAAIEQLRALITGNSTPAPTVVPPSLPTALPTVPAPTVPTSPT